MGPQDVLVILALSVGTMGFIPHGSIGEKDHILTEALLREVVERMGKEFNDAASTYLEFPPSDRHLALMARASKDLENEQLDYDSLIDGNPNPSLRDQEYLQHSSLWGHQYMTGGAGEGEQRLLPSGLVPNKQMIKTDAVLPAYCNPPNPCPVGYTGDLITRRHNEIQDLFCDLCQHVWGNVVKEPIISEGDCGLGGDFSCRGVWDTQKDQGCISEFENTAAFSREYQLAQRCMCDGEHMFSCPPDSASDLDLRFPEHHKSLVAKKFNPDNENPYLTGERLPIAAKKGFEVNVY